MFHHLFRGTKYLVFASFHMQKFLYRSFLGSNCINLHSLQHNLITMKLDTPQFRALFTPELKHLADLFQKYNHEIRIAGGAVRDLLMSKQPEDIDFATTATPDQMKEMFEIEGIRTINAKGEKHGTITARINDKQNFEVTTLRIDVVTDGRHAEVEFTTDWGLDAGRRDLTINAMFLGLDGTLYDYFHGKDDVEQRRIVFVGDAVQRIREDYLRILRYFRFYGRIAVDPDNHEATILEAIRDNAGGLKRISGERIWVELKKILTGNFCKQIMICMIDLGLGPFIGLPNEPNLVEFGNVCNRSLPLKPQPMTLLTALMNKDEVLTLHKRLKLSNYERELALFIVNNREEKNCETPLRPYQAEVLMSKGKVSDAHEWACEVLKYRGDAHLLDELRGWQIPKFPLNGHILLDRGVKGGPKVHLIMSELKNAWIESDFTLTKDELLEMLTAILKRKK